MVGTPDGTQPPEFPGTDPGQVRPRARPRVLLIAPAVAPGGHGAPQAAWSLARALAGIGDVHLVTQARNRAAVTQAGLAEGTDFSAIDGGAVPEGVARAFDRSTWLPPSAHRLVAALTHPAFERRVLGAFGDKINAGDYDIVHRLTPLSPDVGGPLAEHCMRAKVPFVLGPVNGGAPWPGALAAARPVGAAWLAGIEGAVRRLPGRDRTLRHAAVILAGSHAAAAAIPEAHRDKVIWLPDDGVDPHLFAGQSDPPPEPLRVCFIGRIAASCGPDILLEAAAPLLREGRVVIDMIGDGPLLGALRAQAQREGTAAAVRFHGWLSQADLRAVALQAAVLASPTLQGGGGAVVVEAMALGLAPVVLDHAGPGELVTDGVGWKVPPGDRATIVAGFRKVLAGLAADPDGVAATGGSARARVRTHFTWAAKARQASYVYDWLRGIRATRPVFYSQSQPILSYLPEDGATEGDTDALG